MEVVSKKGLKLDEEEYKKYIAEAKCPRCGNKVEFNLLDCETDKPTIICEKCRDANPKDPSYFTFQVNIIDFIPEVLTKKYKFITTWDKDENLFVYDDKERIWSDEKAVGIIKNECEKIFNHYNTNKVATVIDKIKAKTIEKRDFATAMRKIEDKIYYNFKNGVVEFDIKTKEAKLLENFDASNLKFLAYFPVEFKKTNKLPGKFLGLLWYIADGNEVKMVDLLEAIAYIFVPGYPIKKFIAIYGPPNGGKTTFFMFLEKLVGMKNVSHLTLQAIAKADERMFTLTKLYGKLANIADDLPNRAIKDPSIVKMITGESTVSGERKFGAIFDFVNEAKVYISANELPEIPNDSGLLDRLKLIEFNKTFKGDVNRETVLDYYFDEEEKSRLVWFIFKEILPELINKSKFTYNILPEEAKIRYYANSNSSYLFWTYAVELESGASVEKREFYEKYQEFCEQNNFSQVTEDKFWKTRKEVWGERVYEGQKQTGNKVIRYIYGLKIKENLLITNLTDSTPADSIQQPSQGSQPFYIPNYENQGSKYKLRYNTPVNIVNPIELHLQRINNHNQEPAYHLAKLIPNSHINKSLYKENNGKDGNVGNGGNSGNIVTNPITPQSTTQQPNFLPIKLALQNLKEFDKDFETAKFVMDYLKQNYNIKIAVVDEIFKVIDKLEENGNIFKNPSTKKYEWLRFEDGSRDVDV